MGFGMERVNIGLKMEQFILVKELEERDTDKEYKLNLMAQNTMGNGMMTVCTGMVRKYMQIVEFKKEIGYQTNIN